MPYPPVQPLALTTSDGIRITWVRRGRVDADPWDPLDIPLGEATEAYEVAVERPGAPPRVLSASAPAVLYPASVVAADFDEAPATLAVTIRELSAIVGPGFPLVANLPVR